jgi:septal ring factor EnvC (AmiA/AmiB activator)
VFLHAKHAESIGAYEASKTGERVIGKGKGENSRLENNSKKSDSTIKIDYKKKKELEKAIKKVDKKINRLEKSVAEAEKELELKNQIISEVDSADMKLMTNLSYEFEEIQKMHDSYIMEWENALILKEELEVQLS